MPGNLLAVNDKSKCTTNHRYSYYYYYYRHTFDYLNYHVSYRRNLIRVFKRDFGQLRTSLESKRNLIYRVERLSNAFFISHYDTGSLVIFVGRDASGRYKNLEAWRIYLGWEVRKRRNRYRIGVLRQSGNIEINLDAWRIKTGHRRIRRCCIMRCYAYNDIENVRPAYLSTRRILYRCISRMRERERGEIKKKERGKNVLRAVNKRRPVAALSAVLILIKRAPEKYYRCLITSAVSAVRTEAKNDGQ